MVHSNASLRVTLAASAVFNCVAAYLFAFPGSAAGQLLGLPPTVGLVYAAMTSWLILVLAAMYAWVAIRAPVDRSLLTFGALGKLSVVAMATVVFATGGISTALYALSLGDLAFATWWLVWLRSSRDGD